MPATIVSIFFDLGTVHMAGGDLDIALADDASEINVESTVLRERQPRHLCER